MEQLQLFTKDKRLYRFNNHSNSAKGILKEEKEKERPLGQRQKSTSKSSKVVVAELFVLLHYLCANYTISIRLKGSDL